MGMVCMFRFVFTVPPSAVLRGGFFDVRAGRYPHPRICRKFTREGGAVSARHTQGSDHPLPGAPRPGGWAHRPARQTSPEQSGKHPPARWTLPEQSGEAPPARTSPEQSRKVLCPGGLSQSKAEKCAARRTSPEQSRKVCPAAVLGGGSVCPPGRQKPPARRKKNRVFSRPLRACIRKRGLLFRKKTVDFSARQSDGCTRRAGNRPEGTAGPGGRSRRREKGDPHENPDLRHRDRDEPHHPPAGRAGGRGNPRRRSDLPACGRRVRRLGGHRAGRAAVEAGQRREHRRGRATKAQSL